MKYSFLLLILLVIPFLGISGNISSADTSKSFSNGDLSYAKEIVGIEARMNSVEKQMNDLNAFRINAIYGFLAGLILTLVATFFSLAWATRETVYKELGRLTGIERSIVKRNLKEFNKHNTIRKNTKIAVVSKDRNFDESFKKVMRLFEFDVDSTDNIILVEQETLFGTKNLQKKLLQYDIVILENTYINKWELKDTNQDYFVSLIKAVCSKTSLIYYGKGNFPSVDNEPEKQALVSYTNAASQLYGNLLNMIKFREELKIKV